MESDSDDGPAVFARRPSSSKVQQKSSTAKSEPKFSGNANRPSSSRAKPAKATAASTPGKKEPTVNGSSSADIKGEIDDDIPIGRKLEIDSIDAKTKKRSLEQAAAAPRIKSTPLKKPKAAPASDSEDDAPLAARLNAGVSSRTLSSPSARTPSRVSSRPSPGGRASSQNGDSAASPPATASGNVVRRGTPRSEGRENGEPKWQTLEHNGVVFPPPYTPHGVKILYKGQPVQLTPDQEEVATMFAVMRETDYASKSVFLKNFWNDWKEILGPKHVIQSLEECDFTPIWEWHLREKEKKKSMTAEEKKRLKEEKMKAEEKYLYAIMDGVKEKIGNMRVEPPGLFRGRGEHPKMGKLKKRIMPEDITLNIGKDAPVPECPIPGHSWKEVRRDNTVTWLAYWNDPINPKEFKYVFLSPASSIKGQSDKEKYEKARKLKDFIADIRRTYTRNFDSTDVTKRQIAVATYLIDRLALRAGNEKDEDEADTVGCCSLKYEHVEQIAPKSIKFDFLGKDSIQYLNTVEVEPKVYKAIGDFRKGKKPGDDLFDQLDTSKLNAHLKEIMPSLTAKVFRTYNASITLDNLLQSTVGRNVPEKVADYQRANKEVAILCNHQRAVSKAHGGQMDKLKDKMEELENQLKELKSQLSQANKRDKSPKSEKGASKQQSVETLEKKIKQTEARIDKMKIDMSVKEDMKTVALGTSKINYMDPRISIAWCKRHEVPIEKIFNKSLLAKFAWAMDVDLEYRF